MEKQYVDAVDHAVSLAEWLLQFSLLTVIGVVAFLLIVSHWTGEK